MTAVDPGEKYIVSIMPSIPGWFNPNDALLFRAIDRIQKANAITGHLVEVGVYRGKSIGLLATFRREHEVVHGFDLFTGAASLEQSMDAVAKATGTKEGVRLTATNSLTIPDAEVRRIVADSVRFLHIDGGHEYNEALSDMRKFTPLLREDGIVALDDYYDRDFPGVRAATADFTRDSGMVPFLSGDLKIYLCLPKYVKPYISALLDFTEVRAKAFLARYRDQPMLMPFASRHKDFEGPLLDFIKNEKELFLRRN